MSSSACVEKQPAGWVAKVDWGFVTATHGPYRWRWLARLIAWLEDGQH